MKKLLLFLPVIAVTFLWSSWQKPVEHRSMINKQEVISCMNSETIEAYLQEATTPAFGTMQPDVKKSKSRAFIRKHDSI
jgi:hypothetical protein